MSSSAEKVDRCSPDVIQAKVIHEVELLASKSIEDPGDEIFKSGFLDSMNVLHIISFLEEEFKISIDPFDISLETLDSVTKIVQFVEKKLAE